MNKEWLQYKQNPHIQKNSKSNEFRCKTCSKILGTNAGAAGYHSKSSHNLSLSGEQIKNDKTKVEKIETKNRNSVSIVEIDQELSKRKSIENNEADETNVDNMVFHDIQRDVVKGASQIARDPILLYEFHMLKLQNKIPYDWDFFKWIKACVTAFNKLLKIQIGLWQDINNVPGKWLEWQKSVYQENAHLRNLEESENENNSD